MKKHLLTAVLAVVAVGGVFAKNLQKANFTDYEDADGNPVSCTKVESLISCEGLELFYAGTELPVDQIDLIGTFRQP